LAGFFSSGSSICSRLAAERARAAGAAEGVAQRADNFLVQAKISYRRKAQRVTGFVVGDDRSFTLPHGVASHSTHPFAQAA